MPRPYSPQTTIFALIGLTSSFNFAANSTLFSLFAQKLGFSPQLTGILLSILTVGSMFGAPFLGRLVDSTGKRKIILLLGILGQGIFTLLTPLTGNFWLLALMRFLLGVCIVAQAPVLNELVITLEDPQLREQSLIFLNLARSIGFSVGSMVSGILVDLNISWNFYFSGLLALGMVAPVIMFIQNIDKVKTNPSEQSLPRRWFFGKRVLIHYLSATLRAIAVMGVSFFLPLFWQNSQQSATSSGTIIGIANLAQMLFFPVVSRVCSRMPEKSSFITLLGYSMSILPFYIFPFLRGWIALLPQIILSISYVFFYTGAIFFTREIVSSKHHAEALGWLETSINLGGAIGPIIFANFLVFNGNNFSQTILLFSLFPFISMSLFTFIRPVAKK